MFLIANGNIDYEGHVHVKQTLPTSRGCPTAHGPDSRDRAPFPCDPASYHTEVEKTSPGSPSNSTGITSG
jgi:hypothetical protein